MKARNRVLTPSKGSFFLLGPRGTGKTLWTRQAYPDAIRIDLLDPETFRLYAAKPERLRERVEGAQAATVVVVDEVQKLTSLLEVVHLLISEGSTHQFVLTGSSARKLRRGNVNLLGGRATMRTMHPYIALELGASFSLDRALQTGMIPVVQESVDPADSIHAYNALYIKEEVQAEGLVRNTENFTRFLEAISFSQGSQINLSNVARECQVSRKTVEGYVSILEDLLLAYTLPVFTKHAKRILAAHPKFYFFDVGLYRANRPFGVLDNPSAIDGIALESLVAQHLQAGKDYAADARDVYYWRTKAGLEVDFVVYGPSIFHAYEVKNSGTVRPQDLTGLRAFLTDYPEASATLLYRGTERLVRHGILLQPIEEWLPMYGANGVYR
ncbi:ATP-binding protein [soil metagenome]